MFLYYYVLNAQGDVVGIVSSEDEPVAWYEYDAWGNVTGIGGDADIANANPIRYRGYYYDTETGFYYLNSRYYDPETCRFVNADGYASTGRGLLGNNMFVYCLNNPANANDYFGNYAAAVGLTANITIFAGASIAIYWVWDDEGNYGLQWSYSHPFNKDLTNAGIADAGAGIAFQWVDVDTIYDLEGLSTAIGLSVGGSVYVGTDAIWTNPNSSIPDGFQVTLGVGAGYDGHVNKSRTQEIWYNGPNPATKKPRTSKPVTSSRKSTVNRGGGMRNRVMMF